MDKTVIEDVGQAVKVGLNVFDRDGAQVGYVDQVDKQHGWMLVRSGDFDQKRLWIPYRLVKSVDEREIFVNMLRGGIEAEFAKPPARSTVVAEVEGKKTATTTELSGYDSKPAIVSEVDVDRLKQRLAVDQRVWTSDDSEVGRIKDFDASGRYMVVETGALSRRHQVLVPIALVADVEREAAEVTLAVSEADVERMKTPEPADFVIELSKPLDN